MKKKSIGILACLAIFAIGSSNAQFKRQAQQEASVSDGLMMSSSPSLFMGWFNPERFHMRHSVDMSFATFGGQSLSLASYTNSMMYEVADNLNARADVSFSYSPFSSNTFLQKQDLSSVYLSRAEVNYEPSENFRIQLQFRQVPFGRGSYSPFYDRWDRDFRY